MRTKSSSENVHLIHYALILLAIGPIYQIDKICLHSFQQRNTYVSSQLQTCDNHGLLKMVMHPDSEYQRHWSDCAPTDQTIHRCCSHAIKSVFNFSGKKNISSCTWKKLDFSFTQNPKYQDRTRSVKCY